LESFSSASGVGQSGEKLIEGEVTIDQVRAQTGLIGLAITIFSATSFARAVQRMHERIWEQPHIGGISGARRCLLWLLGWLLTVQLIGGLRTLMDGLDGIVGHSLTLAVQGVALSLLWLMTSWLLLFGRVPWTKLALGALILGYVGVIYNRSSALVMPPYVRANAEQFGTLGVILAVSTWLIGFAAIMVAANLIGRVVSEDPTVLRLVRIAMKYPTALWARLRRRLPKSPQPEGHQEDEPAAR
jgi:membrane protein